MKVGSYTKGGIQMSDFQTGTNMFYLEKDGEVVAKITYVPLEDERIDVNHTFVSDQLRGQGIAGQLVDRVVAFAREEGRKIVPTCSYVKARMERNEKYHDVLAK